MTKQLSPREETLNDIQSDLTQEINNLRDEAVKRASNILNNDVSLLSLNAILGSKNNTYVDSVRTQFLDFEDFFSKWLKGLNDAVDSDKEYPQRASHRIVSLLKDEKIFQYTQKLLERNFYNNIYEMIRLKPDETLWEIWFGDNKQIYGLLIAPQKTSTGWRIDKSEIRKANYCYWTVGHIMETGLIEPSKNILIKFNDLDEFYNFYLITFGSSTKSTYERRIYLKYVDYLKASSDPMNEPFLIPEFRYKGLETYHEHRLDFTVLNQHSVEFIGYEISPVSTHMQVANLKEGQLKVNQELKGKWEKEMAKRNKYFGTFGITTNTFTDTDLKDIDSCFNQIKSVLSKRPVNKISVAQQKARLNSF